MTEIVKVEESHKADYMALFLLADPSLCCRSDGLRPRHVRAEKFGDG